MTKNKIITSVVLGIMLIGMLLTSGCLAATTTSSDGTATPTSWYDQYGFLIIIVVIFGVMYLLMIRPQRKRQKEQQKMMSEMQRGDEVITNAGIYGKIESIDETSIVIKVESGATMRLMRNAVVGKRTQG